MPADVADMFSSCIPYDPSFIAKIALESYANPHDSDALALQYGVPANVLLTWRCHLELTAARLFAEPVEEHGRELLGLSQKRIEPHLAALEQMNVSIAVLEGLELRYRYANPAYLATALNADIIGRRMRDVFPVSMTDGVEAGLLNVLLTGQRWEVQDFRADVPGLGITVWEGNVSRLPVAEGEPPAVVIWIRDVTAATLTQDSLRQQVALLQAISENSTDVMFAKDRSGCFRFANPAALALIGKPLKDVIGKTDVEVLQDKEVASQVMLNDQRIMETGHAEEVEETVPLPDGTHRLWLSQKRPYQDENGRVIGLLGVSRDITDRKNSEEKVRTAHDTLQRVLDSITDGLAVLDHNWCYTYFSETGARILGVRSEDLLGKCLWDLFPHAAQSTFGLEYQRAVETGVATHFEEYYPAPLDKWIECHCYPSQEGLSVYFRDVSDRRLAQNTALENRRRITAVFEATPVGLAYIDGSGHVLVLNAEAKRIWGNPPEAYSTSDYVEWKGWWADQSEKHGLRIDEHEWPTARALRGEQVLDTVLEIEPFDMPGTRRIVLHRSVPIQDDEGIVVGAVTAMTDVTEFMLTKREVIEGHHRIQQLANTIPQLAWMADRYGSVHWFNDRWFDYTGREKNEMEGWGWEIVHHPNTLPEVLDRWKYSIEHGTSFEMTFPIKDKNGQYRPFYSLAEPLKNLDGEVVQWFGTCTDVSKLQIIQEDLTKTQHWLQEGLETGNMVAWEWDFESDEIRYSGNALAVLGSASTIFSNALQSVHEEDRPAYQDAIELAIAERGVIDHLTRRIRSDNGKLIWIRTKGNVLVRQDGTPSGIRGILLDVTEQVLHDQALEDASNRKDEFLAMLAHELRNPLAPIATAADLLMIGGATSDRVKSASAIISRQIGHMTRLIDDLLDVSRVTRGLVELDTQPVRIKDIVNNAIEQARPLIEARRHDLMVHVDSTPAVVLGDEVRLCQIVVNLLNNAAKYTPQGGRIKLDIRVEGDVVRIIIDDNGIGIDNQLLPRVFELFTQATRTPDRAQGGLGLGLALVDSLVRMHRGQVEAISEGLGKGSRFIITLPVLNVDSDEKKDSELSSLAPQGAGQLSVMVVDDNIDAADMLADILRFHGHAVRVEYSSTAALATALESTHDLYVLDIGLPDLDGYELVRQLRAMPQNERAIYVAVTGYGQAREKVLSKSAGFDHHLVKPLDIVSLDSIVRTVKK